MEGLCMLFLRLAYPCRYSYMMARFGKPTPVLSMITNEVLDFIYTNHSHRILQWNPAILQPVELEEYANAIQIKGGALDNFFGFIDGTVRPISRPGKNQRIVYDGHKRVHELKFQSLASLGRQMAWLPICMDLLVGMLMKSCLSILMNVCTYIQ